MARRSKLLGERSPIPCRHSAACAPLCPPSCLAWARAAGLSLRTSCRGQGRQKKHTGGPGKRAGALAQWTGASLQCPAAQGAYPLRCDPLANQGRRDVSPVEYAHQRHLGLPMRAERGDLRLDRLGIASPRLPSGRASAFGLLAMTGGLAPLCCARGWRQGGTREATRPPESREARLTKGGKGPTMAVPRVLCEGKGGWANVG
jgi:hypothetical protein